MKTIENFGQFKKVLESDPGLQQEFKTDPVKAVQQFQFNVPDNWVYRLVVGSLGLCILFVIAGMFFLSYNSKSIDTTITTLFTAIASGAIGALAGLLSPSPRQSN